MDCLVPMIIPWTNRPIAARNMMDPAVQNVSHGLRDRLGSRLARIHPTASPIAMSGVTIAGRRSMGAKTTVPEATRPTTSR